MVTLPVPTSASSLESYHRPDDVSLSLELNRVASLIDLSLTEGTSAQTGALLLAQDQLKREQLRLGNEPTVSKAVVRTIVDEYCKHIDELSPIPTRKMRETLHQQLNELQNPDVKANVHTRSLVNPVGDLLVCRRLQQQAWETDNIAEFIRFAEIARKLVPTAQKVGLLKGELLLRSTLFNYVTDQLVPKSAELLTDLGLDPVELVPDIVADACDHMAHLLQDK